MPRMDVNADAGAKISLRFDVKTCFLKSLTFLRSLTWGKVRSLIAETPRNLHEAAQDEAQWRRPPVALSEC